MPVQALQPLNLTVVDSTQRLAEAIDSLNTTLQQFVSNEQTLEDALKEATSRPERLSTGDRIGDRGDWQHGTSHRISTGGAGKKAGTTDNSPRTLLSTMDLIWIWGAIELTGLAIGLVLWRQAVLGQDMELPQPPNPIPRNLNPAPSKLFSPNIPPGAVLP